MQSPDWIQATCTSPTDIRARKLIPAYHPTKYNPSNAVALGRCTEPVLTIASVCQAMTSVALGLGWEATAEASAEETTTCGHIMSHKSVTFIEEKY